MKGYLPDAEDWQYKLPDGRILAIGFFSFGEDANLNCVIQKDKDNGADSYVDFALVHDWQDITARLNKYGADKVLADFVAEVNPKLSLLLSNDKPTIPTEVFARLKYHFRWNLSFNTSTNKIVFNQP